MSDKEDLVARLKAKLDSELIKLGRDILVAEGEEFWEGKTDYIPKQCLYALNKLKPDQYPIKIRALKNVLYHTNQPYPERVANVNDDEFPAQTFLDNLLEPAMKYGLDDSYEGEILVQYFTRKHDPECPSVEQVNLKVQELNRKLIEVDNEDEREKIRFSISLEDHTVQESIEMYMSCKREAVENLCSAFANRGPISRYKSLGKKPDNVEVSATITSRRYGYLTRLAKLFEENPEHPEVVNFVVGLSANAWGEEKEISLLCDDEAEMQKLHEKYGTIR